MKASIYKGLNTDGVLQGGLEVQRKAKYLISQRHMDESPETRENRKVCAYAYAVSEENAGGGVVVTAPTCGASGVLPAVLLFKQEQQGFSDMDVLHALANGRHHRKPYKDQRLHFRCPMRLPGRSRKRMLHGRSSIGRAVSYGYGSDRICCRSCHGTSSRADLRPHKRSCPDPLHRKECRGCHACNQCSEPGKFSYPYPQDFL